MDFGLKGKTVLVSAGSQGLGRACAAGFAAEGSNTVVCGRRKAALEETVQAIHGASAYRCDVMDASQIDAMMQAIAADHGGVDVLVINAGGPKPGPFDILSDEDWQNAVNLTLMSAIRMTRHVLPHMRSQQWGRIVVISSFGVKQPVPGLTLSNAMRMAVLGWAKTLAGQVAADNILVNTVCPGWTYTQRVETLMQANADARGTTAQVEREKIASAIPLGRMGRPEELANLAVFLGSEAASYMTGSAIAVDGGLVEGY